MSSLEPEVNEYLIRKLDEVPERPGIYAWYLKLAQGKKKYNEFHSVMVHRNLDVEARGELGEKYSGKMSREDFPFEKKYRKEDFQLENISLPDEKISLVSDIFAPPIYIGISQNLHNRLREHKNSLMKILYYRDEDSDADDETSDSDFGKRIARILKEKNYRDINSLFIKTVEFEDIQREELWAIEYFLNRTFIPIFGRK